MKSNAFSSSGRGRRPFRRRRLALVVFVAVGAAFVVGSFALASCAPKGDAGSQGEGTQAQVTDAVLAQFQEFTAIPRPSHHEEAIGAYLVQWAKERNFDVVQDATGNVFIEVPATEGMQDKPLVGLQAHMDMVFVCKDGLGLDPLSTTINTVREGGLLTSDGNTSLGADDGIGMAIALQIAEGKMAHGPLRIILTVCEEDGCTGARSITADQLDGVAKLINLDEEENGIVTVSSASADLYEFAHTFQTQVPSGTSALALSVSGLAGGHSGIVINEGRGNAIRIVASALKELSDQGVFYELGSYEGGTANNAIPSSADLVVAVADADAASKILSSSLERQKGGFTQIDSSMKYSVKSTDMPATALSAQDSQKLASLLVDMPDGVYAWSSDKENFPETSSNLGFISLNDGVLVVRSLERSSSVEKLSELDASFKQSAQRFGFEAPTTTRAADPWPYDPDSELLQITKDSYRGLFNKDIEVVFIHAGLECGTFAALMPDLEVIALGPMITDVHSIKETCDVSTIFPTWQLLEEILKNVK